MKVWKDGPEGGTPITAAELNRIEQNIEDRAKKGDVAWSEDLQEANRRIESLEYEIATVFAQMAELRKAIGAAPSNIFRMRTIGFGWQFASKVQSEGWLKTFRLLNAEGFDSVDVLAGRAEWSLADPVKGSLWKSSNSDEPISKKIAYLRRAGAKRINLVVDCSMDAWLSEDTSWRSINRTGVVRPSLPSADAWTNQKPGKVLENYIRDLAEQYDGEIHGIILDNLHWDEGTFTPADLALYTKMTGKKEWPRRNDGTLHAGKPTSDWLCEVMANFVTRLQKAAGLTPLVVNVRPDWENIGEGDATSGHDFRALRKAALGGIALKANLRHPDLITKLADSISSKDRDKTWIIVDLNSYTPTSDSFNLAIEELKHYPKVKVDSYTEYMRMEPPTDNPPFEVQTGHRFSENYRLSTFQWQGYTWATRQVNEILNFGGPQAIDPEDGKDKWILGAKVQPNGDLLLKSEGIKGGVEIIAVDSMGYGTYEFEYTCDWNKMHPSNVFGIFPYDFADRVMAEKYPDVKYRVARGFSELDFIEISRWGDPNRKHPKGSLTYYPDDQRADDDYFQPGAYDIPDGKLRIRTVAVWKPDFLEATTSIVGGKQLDKSSATLRIPADNTQQLHINLWTNMGNKTPTNGKLFYEWAHGEEVLMHKFKFTPHK